jgi:hypothetical protein
LPWIIDYQIVLEQMRQQRLKCLYYNSGAFGFPPDAPVHTIGWIGPRDETIRPAALPFTRQVAAPHEENLASLARRAWGQLLPGRAWIMPMSHWAYELDYGSREWMPQLIESVDLDPGMLEGRNNGAAIEFSPEEGQAFDDFVRRLLEMLLGSDFMLAFPGRPVLCTVHHHKQLWWTTPDESLAAGLDGLVPPASRAEPVTPAADPDPAPPMR